MKKIYEKDLIYLGNYLNKYFSKTSGLVLILCAFISTPLYAQNTQFSNYGFGEIALNPAASASKNLIGVNALYRIQRYNNGMSINSTQMQFQYALINQSAGKRWGGFNLVAQSDKVSEGIPYTFYSIKPGFAYNLEIMPNNFLAMGVELSANQSGFNTADFTTGSQWVNNQGFDETAGLGEDFQRQQVTYFSVATGLMWYDNDAEGYRRNYLGLSVFNLNQPARSIISGDDEIPLKFSALGGYQFFNLNRHAFYAEAIGIKSLNDVFWGAGPRWSFRFEDTSHFDPFTAGELDIFARYFSGDRISLGTQIAQKNFSVGFAVDLHLENTAQMASTEFSVSIFKRLPITKEEELPEEEYTVGSTREFKDDNFQDQPVKVIEKEYKTSVSRDFSFELRKNFNYGFNETNLNDEAKAYLNDIAVMMQANTALKLRVTGHTDNIGTEEANQKISEERAKGVRDYLESLGIAHERLSYEGKGTTEPLVKNNNEENRAKNRRVEFLIYATKD
ncbi:PorP/SprF family type IX secretion system membrane protein [Marivirga sp.]|uniref:PorP/SprF family type IX secretion system membrane protein n=1 Tax=Marivirga sp. TaxID=2018662 RepID=UPI0025E377AF|nr:PorP/SprF family type IX secretion system membrane protein [Marivirga sp.]